MAQVVVRIEDFEDGRFPPVCVSSGVVAHRQRHLRASYEPEWPLIFVLLGPIGFVIALFAMSALTRTVDGWVPRDRDVVDRAVRVRKAAVRLALGIAGVTTAASGLLFLGNAAEVGWAVLAIGLVGVGAAVYAAVNPPGRVKARFAPNGRTVTLTRAHAAFVDAYEDQQQRRRAANREDPSRS